MSEKKGISFAGMRIVPHPYIPPDTIMVNDRFFEQLIGKTAEEAWNKAVASLEAKRHGTGRESEKDRNDV